MISVEEGKHHRVVFCESSHMGLAFRSAVASLVLIFVASCSSIAVAAVGLCNSVVSDELNGDVFSSNLRFHPENVSDWRKRTFYIFFFRYST